MENKKKSFLDSINLKNPFSWWGLILLLIGVIGGGAIGGGLGGLSGIAIVNLGNKPNISTAKKIIYSILITLGVVIVYIVLVLIFLSFLN
jgi:hypothetical protein